MNLFLCITGRRADGYHELQTVFRLLDWGDEVRLRVRDDGEIRRLHGAQGVAEADDLVVRAARLLQQHAGCALGADITVDKHIPMGGGLGGGSSDAATVLVALNHLWQLNLDEDSLAKLGGRLGAYREGIANDTLDAALVRNLYRGEAPAPEAVAHVRRGLLALHAALSDTPIDAMMEGRLP